MNNFILHLGFNHTGTTFLQNYFFDKHSDIINLGKPHFYKGKFLPFRQEISKFVLNNEDFNELKFKHIVDKINKDKKTLLFSDENFSLDDGRSSFDTKIMKISTKLKKVFKDPLIIFTIRNQKDCVESKFLKEVKGIKVSPNLDIKKWVKLNEKKLRVSINYSNTINKFKKYFDKKQIKIFCYEEMLNNKEAFSKRISKYLNIRQSESLDILIRTTKYRPRTRMSKRKFLLMKYFPDLSRSIGSFVTNNSVVRKYINEGDRVSIKTDINDLQLIKETIIECNRALIKDFRLDLKKYDYWT